ncbi:MAG: FAD binding domain-containing protein, partial [Pseudomonadota bacterium]
MYETTYHRADSLADAASKIGDEGKYLAGGQTLLPTMKQRLAAPSDLIDLSKIEDMKGIT